jgi:hypothetical protein
LSRRWIAFVFGVMLASIGLVVGPFLIQTRGVAGAIAIFIGSIAFIVGYLVVWNEAVLRLARRLRATSMPEGKREAILLLSHVAISLTSVGLILALVGVAGH